MSFLRKKVKFYYFILLTSIFITFVYNLKFLKILYVNIGFSSFASIYYFFAIIIAIIAAEVKADTAKKAKPDIDFFPLTVNYQEKLINIYIQTLILLKQKIFQKKLIY